MTHEELTQEINLVLRRYFYDDYYTKEDAESALLQLINRVGEEAIGRDWEAAGHRHENIVNELKVEQRQRLSLLTGKDAK